MGNSAKKSLHKDNESSQLTTLKMTPQEKEIVDEIIQTMRDMYQKYAGEERAIITAAMMVFPINLVMTYAPNRKEAETYLQTVIKNQIDYLEKNKG